MRAPATVRALEELGRMRRSRYFFMREMLYGEVASFHRIANIPDDPDSDPDLAIAIAIAIAAGRTHFTTVSFEP